MRIGGHLKKRNQTKFNLEKEIKKEALTALSLGFSIDEQIRVDVIQEFVGKEQNDYIVIRNHILLRWRPKVQVWLSKGNCPAYDFILYNTLFSFANC
ncbi:lysine-specific histone demethylase 1 homolog 2-like [Amaranthus tricolor]|uniref:lysine-specific histone demethylase 1 homolog 2-like n=1 Tax=Amaranthus tricolor TaxID=29722 RepID=UPI0025885430|nr:lysine-specific histone demethylase 1 homolog 2-like [Amaranthus tricolor]